MKVPKPGVWCPAVTFFDPTTGALDLDSQRKYFQHLSLSGLTGLVILGSNAEAQLLTREERKTLMQTARSAVGPDFPLMCGVSGFSVAQVLEFVQDAVQAGADFGLLLPAAYYGGATTKEVVRGFYEEVAGKSELPIVIYNFPGVCNGVDLSSEDIAEIARGNPGRVVGVKLTCGSVAKIVRLTAELEADGFSTFGGQSDFMIGGLAVGSAGCVAAFSNVFPKTIARIYKLYTEGRVEEALDLHRKAALAESPVKAGIASTKYAVSQYSAVAAGIEDAEEKLKPRRPYLPVGDGVKAGVRKAMDALNEIEKDL
ncbi:aldolase [Polyplosphaeria fusca]|uniref:Aldolase n=1 Tax=Polyplosphaeria fusca TaxID=682080 RepID=A0A9P4QLV4_9PLEO|nr:aldolase [Polyplosphaeria fusca]